MKEILLTSSVLILALLVLRQAFRRTISRRVQYALWGLVLVRLLLPVSLPAMEHNVLTAAEPVVSRMESLYLSPLQAEIYAGTFVHGVPDIPELTVGPASPDNVRILPGEDSLGEPVESHVKYQRQYDLTQLLRPVWYGGMLVMAYWMLLANFRFWRKLCKGRTPYGIEGARYQVYLVEEGLDSPCLFGLFRPAVYLTPAAVSSPESLRHVLAHEETHGRHRDPLWALLRCVCLAVYWFDPLVWAAALAAKADCELACDEGALKRLGEAERIPYGRTLLSLIPVRKAPGSPLLTATTMTAGKRQLKDRITRIAENRKSVGIALLAALALTGMVCAATFTASSAGNPVPLTQAEIRRANEAISLSGTDSVIDMDSENFDQLLQISCFFTSYYDDPTEIDLREFLWYCPLSETLTKEDEAEWEVVRANTLFNEENRALENMPVPVHRLRAQDISALLKTYANITLEDIADWGEALYAEEYDAFYTFTSDFGPGSFTCTGGEKEGDTVRLWEDFRVDGTRRVLTLEKEGESWFIRSFQKKSKDDAPTEADSALPNGPLTGEELRYFDEAFFNGDTSLAQLRRQFLLSIYDKPENVDLFQLFYNGVGDYGDITAAERQAAALASPYGEDPGVDLIKIPDYAMEGLVKDWTGLTLEETNQVGMEKFTYLEEYNAYYHFHGDTNARGEVDLFAGERKDGLILLYYRDEENGGCQCVSLRETDTGYTFVSNLPAEKPAIATIYPAQTPQITIPLDNLEPDRPPALRVVHHYNDVARIYQLLTWGVGKDNAGKVIMVYQSDDGNIYAGIDSPLASSYHPDVFLTIDYDATAERVNLGRYQGALGHDGFWISYPVAMSTTYTGYYYFGEDGNIYELLTAETQPDAVDLDGDGQDELVWYQYGGGRMLAFARDRGVCKVELLSLLKEALPGVDYWSAGVADPYSRRISAILSAQLEGFAGRPVTLSREIYFDGESLLVYKPDYTYTDHIRDGLQAPEKVLSEAKRLVEEIYGQEHMGYRLVDGEFAPAPVLYDGWRITEMNRVNLRLWPGMEIEAWNLDYQLHTTTPDTVTLAGASYLDEDLWQGGFFYNGMTMLFRVEDGKRIPVEMEEDDYYVDFSLGTPVFPGYVLRILLRNGDIPLSEAPADSLLWMFVENRFMTMELLGTYPAADRDAALTRLARYAAGEADGEARERFQQDLRLLERDISDLTEPGREAYQALLRAVEQAGS